LDKCFVCVLKVFFPKRMKVAGWISCICTFYCECINWLENYL